MLLLELLLEPEAFATVKVTDSPVFIVDVKFLTVYSPVVILPGTDSPEII